jgi:septal ring factor EnvC (AmiA/AmiB activator)
MPLEELDLINETAQLLARELPDTSSELLVRQLAQLVADLAEEARTSLERTLELHQQLDALQCERIPQLAYDITRSEQRHHELQDQIDNVANEGRRTHDAIYDLESARDRADRRLAELDI